MRKGSAFSLAVVMCQAVGTLLVAPDAGAQPPPAQYQPPPAPYPPPQQYPPQQYPPQQYPPPNYAPPPYPPPQYQPYPPQQPYPPPQYAPPPQYPPQYQPPPAPAPPPPAAPEPPDPPAHAPKFSLWVGPRLSYLGFGLSFYQNRAGENETTGNFLGNGVAPQLDIGARLGRRYIPYLFIEHGFMAQGHRFEGTNASSSTDFFGIGLRYASGDVDSVSFLTDISIGKRVVRVSNGSETYSMSGLEFFKLGLGAEIRVATLFAITPLLSVSTGMLNDTAGDITFGAEGSKDGITHPAFVNNEPLKNSRAYVVLSLGVGVHFDIFGK